MNLRQMTDMVARRIRRSEQDSHRRQLIRDTLNAVVQDILSRQVDWGFLRRTTEILTVATQATYAMPSDFGYLDNRVEIDGVECQVFASQDKGRFDGDTSRTGKPSVTIRQLTTLPLFSGGVIYPVFGSSQIKGAGTAFDSRAVGRHIKSKRGSHLYQVKSVDSATQVTLVNEYGDKEVAGRVSIYAADRSKVVGSPGITNLCEDMVGEAMQVEGNGTKTFQVSAIDETRQIATVLSNTGFPVAGSGLIFSIGDSYEVDPPGTYVLYVNPAPASDDLIIEVDYHAIHNDLSGDYDVPIIPRQFHHVLVDGAVARLHTDELEVQKASAWYDRGVLSMQTNDDPLGTGYQQTCEPDIIRHKKVLYTDV